MSSRPAILLDTNLLILLAAGLTDLKLIATHKRIPNGFDETDFRLLLKVLGASAGLVTCPNVFTEASNLLMQHREPERGRIAKTLAILADSFKESYIPSQMAMTQQEYQRLGLTDAVLLQLTGADSQLLTIDLDLYVAACAAHPNSVNFNHLRGQRADFGL